MKTSRGLDILQKGIHDTTITSLNYTIKGWDTFLLAATSF